MYLLARYLYARFLITIIVVVVRSSSSSSSSSSTGTVVPVGTLVLPMK